MNFGGLRADLFARGFSYLDDNGAGKARASRWINDAMHTVVDSERWPFAERTKTGAAPLLLPDLGSVSAVIADGRLVLPQRSSHELRNWYGDLTMTGWPECFYVDAGSTICLYPAATVGVTVSYWCTFPDMVADSDEPPFPARFHGVIVDLAAAYGYRDAQSPEAQGCLQDAERGLSRMRDFFGRLSPPVTVVTMVGDGI